MVMKFQNILEQLLLEVSKKDILINKLGFNEENAEIISNVCGSLSVFFANKLIEKQRFILKTWEHPSDNESVMNVINRPMNRYVRDTSRSFVSIMDWVRVGLNGDMNQYKNLTLEELYKLSEDWHKSLEGGKISHLNYKEDKPIILDYRENNIGFYWVDLETNSSDEECERMGHCGRTHSGNNIISLRQNKQLNVKYTINVSHLTASISRDGRIIQMKGPSNSKPKPEFFNYIISLILTDKITGFGSEYDSDNDFKLRDLDPEQIKLIYSQKPILFKGFGEQRFLQKLGLIDKVSSMFTLKLEVNDVSDYVDGDWDVKKWKDKEGRQHTTTLFQLILSGDIWELYSDNGYNGDWQGALDYNINNDNKEKIWELLRKRSEENGDDITDLDLENAIKELDFDEIKDAIRRSINDAESNSYHDYVIKTLKDCLEEYGSVTQINDEGVLIEIDLDNFLNDIDINTLDEMSERCHGKLDCIFSEMLSEDYIDKPKFSTDDRWSPDIDDDNFNANLKDSLDEI